MTTVHDCNKYGEELEQRLQLRTSPIALKLLKNENDIPKGAISPKRDRGYHIALCQAFSLARRQKETILMRKEDHWCLHPVIAFGLAELPESYPEWNLYYPKSVADLEAAKRLAKESPRLKPGKYIGLVVAPLNNTPFIPDMVIAYCNSGQLRMLLSAAKYKKGYQTTVVMEPGGACIQATIPVLLGGEVNVAVPCAGDRKTAMAQDDEMVFSFHRNWFGDLMEGLRHADEAGLGYRAVLPNVYPEYPQDDAGLELRKMLGLEIPD